MSNRTSTTSWVEVETVVRGRIMAKVSARRGHRDGKMLYSLRVGTAQLLDDGTTRISSHMSIYDLEDAADLLDELGEKYQALREDKGPRRTIVSRYKPAR